MVASTQIQHKIKIHPYHMQRSKNKKITFHWYRPSLLYFHHFLLDFNCFVYYHHIHLQHNIRNQSKKIITKHIQTSQIPQFDINIKHNSTMRFMILSIYHDQQEWWQQKYWGTNLVLPVDEDSGADGAKGLIRRLWCWEERESRRWRGWESNSERPTSISHYGQIGQWGKRECFSAF